MHREHGLFGTSRIARVVVLLFSCVLVFAFLYTLRATEQSGNSLQYALYAQTDDYQLYAPHLLFVPIIRLLYLTLSTVTSCDAICAGQLHSIFWAVITLLSIYLLLERFLDSAVSALLTALFTLVSHDFWVFSTQLEVYAPLVGCLALLTAVLFLRTPGSLTVPSLAVCSSLWALSVFYHQANVIFLIPLSYYLIFLPDKPAFKELTIICAVPGSVVLATFLIVFFSTQTGKTIEEFLPWTLQITDVPLTAWGEFDHWSLANLKTAIGSQVSSLIMEWPQYLTYMQQKVLRMGFAAIMVLILFWTIVNIFRRQADYKVRGFFLVSFITYFLFFAWWDPTVHKFFLPAAIPLIVLGSMTFRDIFGSVRTFSVGQPLLGTFIGCLIVVTTACNLFSSVLPLKNSRGGDWYYESETLNILAPKDCLILGWGHNQFSLSYHFNRALENTEYIDTMYQDFYRVVRGEPEPERPFRGRSQKCALLRLGFFSKGWFEFKYGGYLPLSQWPEFVNWFFNTTYQDESNSVTFDAFKVVTHLDGPPYLLVDRSTRVQVGSVDAPHQEIERQLNEHLKRLERPGDLATIPSVLEKQANLRHNGHLIFGY